MSRHAHAVRSGILVAAIGVLVATMTTGTASARPVPPDPGPDLGTGLGVKTRFLSAAVDDGARLTAAVEAVEPAAERAGGARLAAAADAALEPCPDDELVLCGTVPVPLDRRTPDGRMVDIHVEVFPHTGSAPEPEGAVFVTCGGPGCSITYRFVPGFGSAHANAFFVLPELWETRDLVFVDQRGVGRSDVVDCPALQAGGPLYESAAQCHDSLGDTADLYATVDVADDLEDVRLALGYGQIDLLGASYAGADMMAYAVRHTDAVRSLVLSSPAVLVGTDPFYAYAPEAMSGVVAAVCGRSPACAEANRAPDRDFAQLLRRLRQRPVTGVGIDSGGNAHDLVVTENLLSNFITYFTGAHFNGPGEIAPAAAALRRGDPVPLLRLAANADPATMFGATDLLDFSSGHSLARNCVDSDLAWDKDAPLDEREAQYAAAYAAEPRSYGPVSKQAWAAPGYLGFQPAPCIASEWEDRPLYPAGTRVEGVPTLILGGEYDLPVPEAVSMLAAEVMVDSTYVSMTATGHDPHFFGCAPELVQRFFATLDVGDTSCADEIVDGAWVPGSFPTRVVQAPPAVQTDGPRASASERRLATVAAWTFMDSVQNNFFVSGDSVALRGGVVDYEFVDEANQWDLQSARFTEDVTMSGLVQETESGLGGEFVVEGPRGTTAMVVEGPFLRPGEVMTVTFDVRGQPASFTVPAS